MSVCAAAFLVLLVAAGPVLSHGGVRHDFRLAGGQWFDGEKFSPRTVYTVAGSFQDAWDGPVEATLDLSGKYVVAPYGDAHTHDLAGGANAEGRIRERLRSGNFYIQNTNNIPKWTEPFRALLNRPESVDVSYANGGLTAMGAHPIQIYDRVAERPPVPGWTKADMPDQAYFVVDDAAALDAKWPLILAGKPDFLKVYLEHSEEFSKRRSDPSFFGKRGLDPALLPVIVKRAHAAHLRVVAHARTAEDFRNALAAGVDQLAHLPLGLLTESDAKRAATAKVSVVTTTLGHWDREGMSDAAVDDFHRKNLALLAAAGVPVAFGVDGHPPLLAEVENVRRLKVFDDAALVRMLTQSTPRAIFPSRKIGCLAAGCEASFLALDGNPLEDFSNLGKIAVRMKQGFVLRLEPAEAAGRPAH
ncbi:MAG: amidohydrolase family protein [Acidobacteriota bacterium]|nr:amidohydrolase family protein [Acidobacteriota bacterium]